MKTLLTIIIALLTLTACSVQKRTYSPGYNFMWNTKKHNAPKQNNVAENKIDTVETTSNDSIIIDDYIASTENKITIAKTEKISLTTVKRMRLNVVKNLEERLDSIQGAKQEDVKHIQKDERMHSAIIQFGATNSMACLLFLIVFILLSLFNISNLFLFFLLAMILGFTGVAALIAGFVGMLQIAIKPNEYKGGWRLLICFLPLLMILLFLIFLA